MKTKTTPKTEQPQPKSMNEIRAELRAAFIAGVNSLAASIAEDIQSAALHNWDKLTTAEAKDISHPIPSVYGPTDYRAARTVILAVYPERLPIQWGTESTKLAVKRVRKWLKNRC